MGGCGAVCRRRLPSRPHAAQSLKDRTVSRSSTPRPAPEGYDGVQQQHAQAAHEPGQVVQQVAALTLTHLGVLEQHAQPVQRVPQHHQREQRIGDPLGRLPQELGVRRGWGRRPQTGLLSPWVVPVHTSLLHCACSELTSPCAPGIHDPHPYTRSGPMGHWPHDGPLPRPPRTLTAPQAPLAQYATLSSPLRTLGLAPDLA